MSSSTPRVADHSIDEQFLNRWSPRAFTGEEISEATVHTFLEAARWAPSASNSQPWRFIYARRGTPHWNRLLGLLNPSNQTWAKNASVLMVLISKDTFVGPNGQESPAPCHTFDSGAAWAHLALQVTLSGWHAHGMAGFDKARAVPELGIPAGYTVEAAIAIGKLADKSTLPETLQAREIPSTRNPVSSFAFEGQFKA
jgi:nitroreductase